MAFAADFLWTPVEPNSLIDHFYKEEFETQFNRDSDIWFLVFYNNTKHDDHRNWQKIKIAAEKTW